jgi:uroporphyrinogen decarboxylase
MRRQPPDRTPFEFAYGFAHAKQQELVARTGAADPNEYFQTDVRAVNIGSTRIEQDHRRYHEDLPAGARLDEWGIGHRKTSSGEAGHSHLEGFLYPMLGLEKASEAEQYPLPDLDAAYRFEHLPELIGCYHSRGLAVTAGMECTIFEVAWYMRSMERLLMDFADGSPFAEVLLDRICGLRVEQARRYAALGVDVIRMGDDIASQRGLLMALPLWRRWIKPRLARVIAAAREARPDVLILYHSDGNVTDAIPDLIEIGIDILNPVQCECMDPAEVKRLYGDRLAFWGTIGTQTTLPLGTPDDVRREIRERVETVGRCGGLLLAPTHMIEPDVPWENLVAFAGAAREI